MQSPTLDFQTYRNIDGSQIKNVSSYTYSAKLTLSNLSIETVGKYSCISVNREFSHKGQDEELNSYFNIYVEGEFFPLKMY